MNIERFIGSIVKNQNDFDFQSKLAKVPLAFVFRVIYA